MVKSILLVLTTVFIGVSSDAQDIHHWYGEYYYSETPVEANAGYKMVMNWELYIFNEPGRQMEGLLMIDGQQTELTYNVDVRGTENVICIYLRDQVDGDSGFSAGDILFSLSKADERLFTTWGKLSPRLIETSEKECSCFEKAQ